MSGLLPQTGSEREGGETETITTLRPKFFDNSGDTVSVRLWEPLAEPNRLQSSRLRSRVPYDTHDDPTKKLRRSRKATQSQQKWPVTTRAVLHAEFGVAALKRLTRVAAGPPLARSPRRIRRGRIEAVICR